MCIAVHLSTFRLQFYLAEMSVTAVGPVTWEATSGFAAKLLAFCMFPCLITNVLPISVLFPPFSVLLPSLLHSFPLSPCLFPSPIFSLPVSSPFFSFPLLPHFSSIILVSFLYLLPALFPFPCSSPSTPTGVS